MKRSFLTLFFISLALSPSFLFAQVGIGTETPSTNAVLELRSPGNNQGFLVPRLTTAQRTAASFTSVLTVSEKGLLVFDTDTNKFYYWNGTAWIVIEDSVGTDNQTLTYTPGTGLLAISGGNNVTITGTLPGGTAGGDLTGTYPNPTIASNAVTTAKINNGAVTAAKLANTSVTAGTYGTATQVPQIIVDAQGRITGVTLVTIAGIPPTGAAGGDLTGTYPNPTVAANAISSAEITDGSITSADITDLTIATADLANASVTATKLANTAVTPATYGTATLVPQLTVDAQGRITGVVNTTIAGVAPGGAAGGDLTGTYPNPTVAANAISSAEITDGSITSADITDLTIATADLANGSVTATKLANTSVTPATYGTNTQVPQLTVDAQGRITGVVNTTISGVAPAGTAGGDLAGTYPNPTVANNAITTGKISDGTIATADLADASVTDVKISTVAPSKITAGGASSGQVLKWNGTNWIPQGDNGTVTSITAGTGLSGGTITTTGTIALANTGVTAGSYGTATTVPQLTIDAQGRVTAATNTTISGTAPGGAAGGDLNGTYPNPTVDALQSRAVAATAPTTGQVLEWNGSSWTPSTDDVGAITLPYAATQSSTSTLFMLTNQGTGRAAQFFVDNPASNSPVLSVSTNGTGFGLVAGGVNFGLAGTSTAQNGAAGFFSNAADRGYGVFGGLQTAGTASTGALGATYLNDGTYFGVGVMATGSSYGVRATGGTYGGYFQNLAGDLYAYVAGNSSGVWARSDQNFGTGVSGIGGGTNSSGVYGSGDQYGVMGVSLNGSGIYGAHTAPTGTTAAILGETSSASASASAVTGIVLPTSAGGSSTGVRGINNSTSGSGIGVYGYQAGSGWGVYGSVGNTTLGYAGYFSGRVQVTGTLSKGGGTFKIDHPLDPTNKYLYHSFVESPDMKNIYDGVVVLDGSGQAEITLPDWFGALNKDFRYQLTCIGGHAPVYISQEVSNNRFSIAGGTPGLKVSWQLTGIRKDPYAEKNRVQVEEDKPEHERGKYLYPEAYGLSKTRGVDYNPSLQAGTVPETSVSTNNMEEVKRKDEQMRKAPAGKGKNPELTLPKVNP